MKIKLLLSTILIFIITTCVAQNIFQKVSGIGYAGHVQSFCTSSDDTFVATCSGSLIKTDTIGNVVWANRYLLPGAYEKSMVINQENGGYIILFEMISGGFGSSDIMVFSTHSDGQIDWIRYFGTDGFDAPYDITELANGDFVICGQTNSFGHADKNILLMRMNKYGNQYWQRSYGTLSDEDAAEKLVYSAFGGFILAGKMSSRICLLRTDDNGVMKWTKTYEDGVLHDIKENPANGELFVCGEIIPGNERGGKNIFVMRTDSSGNTVWSKKIGNNNNEIAYTVSANQDFSQIYVAGEYQTDSTAGSDAFVACLNAADGSILWAKTYGTLQNDAFYDNTVYNANTIVNVGYSDCCDTTYHNLYMVKTTLNGISGCNEYELLPLIDSIITILPDSISVVSDTGELWVTTVCYPPNLIVSQQLTLCSSAAVHENSELVPLIYPNPTKRIVTITIDTKNIIAVEIYNALGQKVEPRLLSHHSNISIDFINQAKGIYLIRISDEHNTYSEKIIVE